MLKLLAADLALALTVSATHAQSASFASYGAACKSTALSVTGLPKLGTSFTVHGIAFPSVCTRKFCGCTVGPCNDCRGSVLFLGLGKLNAPLPGGCPLLVTPDLLFTANFPGQITFPVPNNQALLGVKFHQQRLDLTLKEYITSSCKTSYSPLTFVGTSNGVTGTVGL